MGLGFLPLEKIPIFIWGLLLIVLGGFLLFNENTLSWGQAKALIVVIAGVCGLIYDLKKRNLAKIKKLGNKDTEE